MTTIYLVIPFVDYDFGASGPGEAIAAFDTEAPAQALAARFKYDPNGNKPGAYVQPLEVNAIPSGAPT